MNLLKFINLFAVLSLCGSRWIWSDVKIDDDKASLYVNIIVIKNAVRRTFMLLKKSNTEWLDFGMCWIFWQMSLKFLLKREKKFEHDYYIITNLPIPSVIELMWLSWTWVRSMIFIYYGIYREREHKKWC